MKYCDRIIILAGISQVGTSRRYCCTLMVLFAITIPFLVFLFVGITNVILSLPKSNYNRLAIASDVIDCCDTQEAPLLYSKVNITEVASDKLNDNKNGIPIEVFSVRKNTIRTHNFTDTHTNFEYTLFRNGINRFLIPYNYFNRPWYMRKGSNITVEFALNYTKQPDTAFLYVLKGEHAIQQFLDNNRSEPHYEQKLDIIKIIHKSSTIQINDNGYHYLAMDIIGIKGTVFTSNITFNIVYIDADDYDRENAVKLDGLGDSTIIQLDAQDKNTTLCYVHSIDPDKLESPSVHVDIVYIPNLAVKVPLLVAPFVFAMLYAVVVLLCCLNRWRRHNIATFRRKHYISI